MSWLVANIHRIMILSGALTMTTFYATIAPEPALRSTFGESISGPVADIVVRNWGALIAVVGATLIYAARKPAMRPLALTMAGASKAVFIALVLSHGGRFLGYQAGVAVVVDAMWVIVFAAYLFTTRGSTPLTTTRVSASRAGDVDRCHLNMKAVLHTQYGPANLLQIGEVEKPVPKDDEVLIAVHATTVSTADCNMRNFTFVTRSMRPLARLMFGIGRPWKTRVLGTELAGAVERTGKDVTKFKPGDRVVASTGMACGGHAQFACVSERGALATKSPSLSWEEAVAIPFGANTALYFLRYLGNIQAGQEVLIIGASGSIGSAAVQLANYFGATVTAVCSGANMEMVRSLGAVNVIDYTKDDFTKRAETYDLIFDIVGATTFHRCKRSLKRDGVFLQNIIGVTDIVRILWTSIAGGKKLKGGVAMENPGRMNLIAELAAAGKLRPVIDRRYPLERIAEAFAYVEKRHKKGNVVITVSHR